MTTSTSERATGALTLPSAPRNTSFALQEKVVLLLLTLRAPGNQRTVRDKSILKTNADTARLHVGKRLLDCEEQKAIQVLDGQLRDWIVRMALPSPFKAGTHVIALDLLAQVDNGLTVYQQKRQELVDKFAAVYDEAKAKAKQELGDLFVASEYMTPDDLQRAYSMDWQYVTLVPPESTKALDAAIFEREKARLQAKWNEAADSMREALAVELAELTEDLATRLDGDEKKFKPTKLLERFDEFLSTFNARNVTGDMELQTLADQARTLLAGVDTDALKKSPELRAQVRDGMRAAADALDGKKQRRITFED